MNSAARPRCANCSGNDWLCLWTGDGTWFGWYNWDYMHRPSAAMMFIEGHASDRAGNL